MLSMIQPEQKIMNSLSSLIKRFSTTILIMLLSVPALTAQTVGVGQLPNDGAFTSVYSVGAGYTALYDSYLSANRYSGANLTISAENIHNRPDAKIFEYSETESLLSLSRVIDQPGYSYSYDLTFDASLKLDYKLFENNNLTIYTGPEAVTRLGVIYNPLNSNNPAQLKFYAMIAPHVAGIWRFRVGNYPMALGVKSSVPLLGLTFAPEYGQLYYEMYEYDGYSGSIRCAWPLVMPTIYNNIYLEFPVKTTILRFSYNYNYSFYHYSDNRSAMSNNGLMIGVVKTFKQIHYGK